MPRYALAGCTVSVQTAGSGNVVEVRVAGELDRDATPMLTEVTDYLAGLSEQRVVMELQHLDFAGAALPNWLARMRCRFPDRTPVAVSHPQPLVRWVLTVTEMADLIAPSGAGVRPGWAARGGW